MSPPAVPVLSRSTRHVAVALIAAGVLVWAGCAAHWNGPTPPVRVVPSAELSLSGRAPGIPKERLWTYKHNTYLGAAPVAIGAELALVDHKGRIVFLDPNSGKPRARAKAKYPLQDAPVWDAERFYVVQPAPRRRLEAFRFADGRSLWQRDFTRSPKRPIISGGALVVAAGDSVLAIDPASGRTVRVIAVGRAAWLSPVACGSGLLLADQRGRVKLLDDGGAQLWEHDAAMMLEEPPAVFGDAVVLAGSGGTLVCMDSSGSELWRDSLGAAPLYQPEFTAARTYVIGRDGEVTALDLATGERIWQRRLSAPGARGLEVQENWVAANSVDGVLWLLDPADGAVLDTLQFGELVHDRPSWAFGRLFVVTENRKLHALGAGR